MRTYVLLPNDKMPLYEQLYRALKEDILTGCKAALAGGVTGVLCMPNTVPPADDPEILRYMTKKAKK